MATVSSDLAVHPMYIGGTWVEARDGATFDVHNPATGRLLGKVSLAGPADVDQAVMVAKAAFDSGVWRNKSADERSQILWRVATLIEENAEALTDSETASLGAARWLCAHMVQSCAEAFRYYAGWPTKIHGRSTDVSREGAAGFGYTRLEPLGVVGLITPWNFPLMAAAWKLGPALAAGCTAVLKASEETPLTTLRLAEILEEAGVPPGVVNVVNGDGAVGAAITAHPQVRKVSFTGSTDVGRKIIHAAAGNLKRVSLELGGKSPLVICEDADLDAAIQAAAAVMFVNSGQVCAAGSRLFVQRSVYDKVIEGVAAIAGSIRPGDPANPEVMMGPLISAKQLARVTELVASGKDAGARIVCGGDRLGTEGFFFPPTLLSDVDSSMRVVKEEIFGPVVCAMPFDKVEDLVPQLNDSEYGLVAYVWTRDIGRAHSLAAKIEAGSVYINSPGMVDYSLPMGGFKQSGWGREHGPDGIEAYLETKSVVVALPS